MTDNLQDLFDATSPKRFRSMSQAQRDRVSEAHTGKTVSAESRAKSSASNKGQIRSTEARARMSLAQLNRTEKTPEQKAAIAEKISEKLQGRKKPPITSEHRARLSAALKGRPNLTTSKRIMTPTGEFPSLQSAADWAVANGLPNAYKKIAKWLKTHPELFYYVVKTQQNKGRP